MVSSGEYLCWLYFLRHMVYRDPGTGQVKQGGMSSWVRSCPAAIAGVSWSFSPCPSYTVGVRRAAR